jgi:hypothetical protein
MNDKPKIDADEYMRLLMAQEELHPELKAHLYEIEGFGRCLKHPLVFSILYTEQMNAILNEQYRVKNERAEKSLEEGDFSTYVWMHERPYRWEAFCNISSQLNNEDYWKLARSIWIDSENIWQLIPIIHDALTAKERLSSRSSMMTEDEREFLNELPDEVTVYRGAGKENRKGYSWTVDKETAEWFATRLRNVGEVLTGRVKKSDIIAYISGRDEHEIIAVPGDVKIVASTVQG